MAASFIAFSAYPAPRTAGGIKALGERIEALYATHESYADVAVGTTTMRFPLSNMNRVFANAVIDYMLAVAKDTVTIPATAPKAKRAPRTPKA